MTYFSLIGDARRLRGRHTEKHGRWHLMVEAVGDTTSPRFSVHIAPKYKHARWDYFPEVTGMPLNDLVPYSCALGNDADRRTCQPVFSDNAKSESTCTLFLHTSVCVERLVHLYPARMHILH